MNCIVMGFCKAAGDKEGRTPEPIYLEANAYAKRCLDALHNPRHLPVIRPVPVYHYFAGRVQITRFSDGSEKMEICDVDE